ncbi:MAG: hypothetical protein OCD02_11245 [Spirochaetaceae bacterium]
MGFRIINHLQPKIDSKLYSSYYFDKIINSLIIREIDTLFLATMNDQFQLYNLHLFPIKGLKSFESVLSRLSIISILDEAAYISVAYNIKPKSQRLDLGYNKAIQEILSSNIATMLWNILHYEDGKYTEVYQGVQEE